MRGENGETENIFRVKATEATDKLLKLLLKFHGEDEDDPPPVVRPTIETIQRAVAASFGVTRDEIISDRREWHVVMPRHVAMYLCRELTLRSLPAIGRKFGDKDHTTVHSAVAKITRMIADDPFLNERIEKIRAGFESV